MTGAYIKAIVSRLIEYDLYTCRGSFKRSSVCFLNYNLSNGMNALLTSSQDLRLQSKNYCFFDNSAFLANPRISVRKIVKILLSLVLTASLSSFQHCNHLEPAFTYS